MTASFEDALRSVLQVEGEFSDHPADPGGETRFGITESEARDHGYNGNMRDLPFEVARDIYHENYWSRLRLKRISAWDEPLAEELFDTGVNMGVKVAARFLQRGLNVLNRQEQDYYDIEVDGVVGPKTLDALRELYEKRGNRGAKVLRKIIDSLQGARYVDIAEENADLEAFVFGWFRQRVD